MHPPMPTTLRHTYRDLLRAATYLPDSASRDFVHSRVVYRFRRVSDKIRAAPSHTKAALVNKYHGRDHIRSTSRRARMLERAGLGSRLDLLKVFTDAYGRTGSRRLQLIRKLLVSEGDTMSDSTTLEEFIKEKLNPISEVDNTLFKPEFKRPFVSLKVEALIKSQVERKPSDSILETKRRIRSLKLKIPETNNWGHSFPVKRARNLQKKDWKDVLENMLPPLPDHEWDRLRDLSLGILIEDLPRRRTRPIMEEIVQGDQKASFLLDYFTQPVDQRRIGGLDNDKVIISERDGATYLRTPRLPEHNHRLKPHVHTPRYLRRLYRTIWAVTPKLEYDEDTKSWKATWGHAKAPFSTGKAPAPGEEDTLFFEGTENVVAEKTVRTTGRRARRSAL